MSLKEMGDFKLRRTSVLFKFEKLPDKVVQALFTHFKYEDTVCLRLVNRWFNRKCTKILNETFLNLKHVLDYELQNIFAGLKATDNEEGKEAGREDKRQKTSNIHLRYKILQILKCEACVLSAVCERYVKSSVYCFAGGKILDFFHEITNHDFNLNEAKNPLESHGTMQLFLLNEEFMDYFEEVVEPMILNSSFSPWFGTKVVDILDLYVNSNYHITATYQQESCQVSARYEILNPESTTELKFSDNVECIENLQKFTRYVRNQMRWHNFFYYVDATYDSINIKKRDRRFSKFCLNSSDVSDDVANVCNNEEITIDKFNKTFSRRIGNPCTNENVAYAVELQCSKNCVPERLRPYVNSISQSDNLSTADFINGIFNEPDNFVDIAHEATANYDFLLTLKVVLPTETKNTATENYVELYHNCRNCELTEKSKEIPL